MEVPTPTQLWSCDASLLLGVGGQRPGKKRLNLGERSPFAWIPEPDGAPWMEVTQGEGAEF